jgi:pyruvate-ferredoxin/flavodoxin oxidoreductase
MLYLDSIKIGCEFMKKVMDANKMCSNMAYLFSEVASIYPITPSSPMASNIDFLNHTDKLNLYNRKVELVEMQSEAGAAGAMHGALITGSLATTFTASQGLLLMIPNMYKMAGEMLPGVIHVASRSVATHALSIFGDHSDIYATRATGFCMLSSTNIEDVRANACVAHLSAIKGSIPFLHFFDGFRTSHELETIEEINDTEFLKLIDYNKINEFKNRMLNVDHNIIKGMAENEDIYFQSLEARNKYYNEIPSIVDNYMNEVNKITKTDIHPFNYYGDSNAENIIIAMGSVIDTIKLVVDEENKKGNKIGVVEVHLYRPFSSEYLKKVIPKSVKNIAVLDRTKESGSIGEPLYLDVVASLKNENINIVGGRYGLSSKNTTPSDIYSVYKMLADNLQENFTIGIQDDVTNLSLKKYDYHLNLPAKEIKIYGFGSDGMVSASKDILKIAASELNKEVDGYFEYDSKKSGGVTISNLRLKNSNFKAPFYVEQPDLVVVTKDEYFKNFNMIDDIKENGTLLINTTNAKLLDQKISIEDKKIIKEKNISILVIDATSIAEKENIKGKISKIMEVVILRILGINNALDLVSSSIKDAFKNKGSEVVNNNLNAINSAFSNLYKLNLTDNSYEKSTASNIYEKINRRMGNELKVSDILPICDGSFPGGLSKYEKRKISDKVVKWIPENCIQCGRCSFVCPHAVIRSFKIKNKNIGKPLMGNDEYNYLVSISESDCTGCGLCIDACLGFKGKKALEFGVYDEASDKTSNYYFNSYEQNNIESKNTVKDISFVKPYFEFSGACSGCGEASYIRLLTQIVGKKLIIANATGCSSIYGGSAPSTPYSISWANSLFEDNAEFAYGMYLSNKQKREQIAEIMKKSNDSVDSIVKEKYKEWLENKEDFNITYRLKNELKDLEIPNDLKELIDYIPSRSIWAIGGDGWAYDIGFGGIDHVLSSNEKIKILVLDTEVYSNTGGQMSKSSKVGAVCEFADFGKKNAKKDLFKIAMCYPNCYVGSISLGADFNQTIKTLKEAEEHDGPAIVIAYSPCVEHGIKGGLSCTTKEQALAVQVGYQLLMRYNPLEDKLYLDSKEPDFTKYEEFLDNEVRYNSLKIKDEKTALELLKLNKENAIKRYNFYKEKSTN